MQPLAETGGVTITTPGRRSALADPDILDQVLVGLVGNALKHTPRGGTIRLAADNGDDGPRITVLDTGEGIPPRTNCRMSSIASGGETTRGVQAASASGSGSAASTSRRWQGRSRSARSPGAGTTVSSLSSMHAPLPRVEVPT